MKKKISINYSKLFYKYNKFEMMNLWILAIYSLNQI